MDRQPAGRDVALTVIAAVLVASFLAMCWWQVTRALSGNTLSWAYVFEWPLFAGYVVYLWWRLRHDHGGSPADGAGERAPRTEAPPGPDEQDEELAAYNRYLASLEESGRRKRW